MQQLISIIVSGFFLVSLIGHASARNFADLYTQAELSTAAQLYSENLRAVWREDFLSRLTIAERWRAGRVRLELPLIGAQATPFEYYSQVAEKTVFIPIMSVKFLDDFSITMAYLEYRQCRRDAIFDYAVLLGRSRDYSHVAPLAALGIPDNALDSEYVNTTSANALKSAVYFIMAHEYAHVMFHHASYADITAAQAQQQEIEADNFALQVMNRIGVAPLGMVGYFAMISHYDRVPADFDSIDAYQQYLSTQATHPLSSQRLINIAEVLRQDPLGFARSENDIGQWQQRILAVADDIETIGNSLDDTHFREFMISKAFQQSPAALKDSCRQAN